MSERWTLNALAELSFRQLGGEVVVHHLMSNDTHRMAQQAGWILGRLGVADARAVDEIAAGSPYDVADLTPALHALGELGLIQRC